jgi:hypothetical protein
MKLVSHVADMTHEIISNLSFQRIGIVFVLKIPKAYANAYAYFQLLLVLVK